MVIGVHSVVTETTARVRSEEDLRAFKQRLRRMVNVEVVGVLTFEAATGTLLDANDAFLLMTGYAREVRSGRSYHAKKAIGLSARRDKSRDVSCARWPTLP